MLTIYSYSIKHGPKPPHADLFIDVRHLPNPHHSEELRDMNGTQPGVWDYMVSRDPERTMAVVEKCLRGLQTNKVLAIGCYGGHHRSVAMAEHVAKAFTAQGGKVKVEHVRLKAEKRGE